MFPLPQFVFGDKKIDYLINRSDKASSVIITVNVGQGVQITVPSKFKIANIDQILEKKASWIIKKVDYLSELAGCAVPRSYVDGENLFFLGNRYVVKVNIYDVVITNQVKLNGSTIIVNIPPVLDREERVQTIRSVLVNWYMKEAEHFIIDRVNVFADRMGTRPAKIRVKEQIFRWGSCSNKGNINFNWKIIMAPIEVIDYVIVHELCHLIRLDHSPEFWRLINKVLPDYENRRMWLKKYGSVLTL